MKKNYFTPVLNVTEFEVKDVLQLSGVSGVSGVSGDRYVSDDFTVLGEFGE